MKIAMKLSALLLLAVFGTLGQAETLFSYSNEVESFQEYEEQPYEKEKEEPVISSDISSEVNSMIALH